MKRINKQLFFPFMAALLLMAGCNKENTQVDITDGVLRFEVRVDNGWNGTSRNVLQSRAAITTTTFPGSAAGTTYQIGISILKEDGITPYVAGADHILAELTVKDGSPDVWRYQLKGSSDWLRELPKTITNDLMVSAYYPYNSATVLTETATNVPFDLTTLAEQNNQTDLLYAAPQVVNISTPNILNFKHFYSLFEFRIKKKYERTATLTGVQVSNSAGKTWVANAGEYNARMGTTEGTPTAGDVSVLGLNLPLSTTDYQTVQVLLPSNTAMDAYTDGGIRVQFLFDNGASRSEQFLVKREWLFTAPGKGLMAGLRYSFQLLYDPTPHATSSFTLIPWRTNTIEEDIARIPIIEYDVDPNNIITGSFNGTTYSIPSPTTDTYCNNIIGSSFYTDMNILLSSAPPYKKFEVAIADEVYSGVAGSTDWEKGWNACKAKSPAGVWRLPCMSELMLMYLNSNRLEAVPDFEALNSYFYWSAAEKDSNYSWYVDFANGNMDANHKSCSFNVRCIREL